MSTIDKSKPQVTIEHGLSAWQILQQNADGCATVTLGGRWWTAMRRQIPEVRVRVVKEGTLTAISNRHNWVRAETQVDPALTGDSEGKGGTWKLVLESLPRGGPYRIETLVGGVEMSINSRPRGEVIHFVGVGDVWLIAGQSNAYGYGTTPIDEPSEIGIHEYGDKQGWRLAVMEAQHHPWLAFAKSLRKELGYPIGLVPTAVGGTPVSRWDPGQNGDLYHNMIRTLKSAGGGVRGVLWYQGESDALAEIHTLYKERFTRFVTGVRKDTGNAELPILTVQLNRFLTADRAREWEAIQEYQRQLSRELDRVYIFSVFESVLCDVIHNSSLGNLLIAQRAVDAALGGVYGRDVNFRPPECVRVTKVGNQTLELEFDHVYAGLDYSGLANHDFAFAVRDRSGDVPVASFRIKHPNRFILELARSLSGSASVTGVPAGISTHNVPRDADGARGMLAFTQPVL